MSQEETITALLTPASAIKPQKTRWLWACSGHGVIPLGTGTVMAGYGGEGKTTFILDLIAQLSRGELEGDLQGTPYPAILFTPEDAWEFVTIPRLTAAGANLDNVYQLQERVKFGENQSDREMTFPQSTALLEEQIIFTGAKVILLDPASQMMGALDMNKAQDVRRAFAPLMAVAAKHEVAIIMISHFNKGAAGRTQHKVSGSHAWRDITRSMLVMAIDPDTNERVITQDKNNYGTGLGSWKFALESVSVPIPGSTPTEVGRVKFLGASDTTVGELVNREVDGGDDDDKNAAQMFVVDFIRNSTEPEVKAGDVIKAGRAAGFTETDIKNARKRCTNPKIVSVRPRGGSGWVWAFEDAPEQGGLKVAA